MMNYFAIFSLPLLPCKPLFISILITLLSACQVINNPATESQTTNSLHTFDNHLQPQSKNTQQSPIVVIAHRGASGHLPEHTMASKALAYGMGADFIEQDVVMSKDNHLIVHHDLTLDATTNVATLFPNRNRQDGHYYVIDFTLAELKTLSVFERITASGEAKYPNRFPINTGDFRLHTFAEELALIQALNKSHHKNVGIYPEVKSPWFHHQAGKDISLAVLQTLKTFGYTRKSDKVFLQSFDAEELKRIHNELLPTLAIDISLVQLIAFTDWQETKQLVGGKWQNYSYDWMFTSAGIKQIAEYADGIGPWFPMLIDQNWQASTLLVDAQQLNLDIHPYTFRLEDTPKRFADFEEWLQFTYKALGITGFFTDFPAKAKSVFSD